MENHNDLQVWQKAMDLVAQVYAATQHFPEEEKFGITSQIRRCAVSIPSNIAEGHGRNTDGDFLRFLRIAYGSTAELETQLLISKKLEFISIENFDTVYTSLTVVRKMLNKLMKKVATS